MTLVLLIQSLVFSDGGLTALGTNVLNMAVVAGFSAYLTMRGIRALLPSGRGGFLVSTAVASWLSVVLAAGACALELAISGTSPLWIVVPAMVGTHAVIGIGEALITTALLSAVAAARPDLLPAWARIDPLLGVEVGAVAGRRTAGRFAAAGFALALLLAGFISPLASSAPDGLEKVAQEQHFLQKAEDQEAWHGALLPDYTVPGIREEGASTGTAGLLGTMAMFALGYAMVRMWSVRSGERES